MLFDPKERTLETGIPYGMGPFDYLDQSARPEAMRVRALMEQMLEQYPLRESKAMMARLRTNEEVVHNAAFFELCLHELLLRRDFKIADVEQEAPGSSKRPDYLVRSPGGVEFFLEATLASGEAAVDRGAKKRLDAVLGVLSVTLHPHFRVAVLGAAAPPSPVNGRRLRSAVLSWLNSLDPNAPAAVVERNEIAEDDEEAEDPFVRVVTIDEYSITLRAERRTVAGLAPPGIAYISNVRALTPGEAIRKKVGDKASRYGRDLGKPFVIAINSTQVLQRDEHFEQAVFGSLQYAWPIGDADAEVEVTRRTDGLWLGAEGPQYRRVSGVLCFSKLTPWGLSSATVRFIENPFAEHPMTFDALGVSATYVEKDVIRSRAGLSIADILELPAGWPE
jgi:hypothetical protein